MAKQLINRVVLALTMAAVSPCVFAQSDIYDVYYADTKALRSEHMQKLAEIDRQHDEAIRAFNEENVRRAQALAADNNAAHKALKERGLKGDERQSEYRRIQAEDRQRRNEYAKWRDATSSKIRDEYRTARNAELARHKGRMEQLLAERNANLARARASDTRVGRSPGTESSLGESSTDDESTATAGQEHLERGDGSHIAEVGTDNATGSDGANDDSDNTSVLTRDNEGEAGHKVEMETPGMASGADESRVDAPVRDDSGEYFEYPDGSLVRAVGPDGQVGQVNDKGDIVYGDGTTIVHTGDQEITIHKPDGSSSTKQLDADGNWKPTDSRSAADYPRGTNVDVPVRSDTGDSFIYDDGSTVRAIGPEGDLGKVNDKGDIVFGDGTTIVHTGEQEITIHRPDGTSTTQRADENHQWRPVSGTKPYTEGKGSNEKYVSTTGGGSSGGGDNASGSADGSGSSSNDSNDSGSDGNDNSKDTKDSSSGNDSDESGSADGGSSDTESSDSGEDADTEGKGKEYYGESGSGRPTGPSGVVQGIVDRATGQSRDVETGVPQPCSESGGFGVTQPGPGGSGNCVPGHLPTVSEENDQQPDTPDAGASADAEDARRAGGTDIGGRITQPGLGQEGIPVEDLPSQSALDQSPVVNPPRE